MSVIDENGSLHERLWLCSCKVEIMQDHLERVAAILGAAAAGADDELRKLTAEATGKVTGIQIYLGEYL